MSSATPLQQRATIGSRIGLHARTVAIIAQKAASLDAAVRIGRDGRAAVDARSALLLLTLGAEYGDEVVVEAEGAGADAALAEMVALVESDLDA